MTEHSFDTDVDGRHALESWLKVSRALVDDLPLDDVLDVIASVARELTGNLYAMVALVDERRERLVVRGSAGFPAEYLTFTNDEYPFMLPDPPRSAETPTVRAFREGRSHAVLDALTNDDLAEYRKAIDQQGYRSVLSIPLGGPGELGVLTVYAPTPDEFQQSQIDLLSALAHGAAAAIEIARLRDRNLVMMAELQEVDLMHQQLTRVALAGTGLDPILRSLSEMTGYDTCIEDFISGTSIAAWPVDHLGPQIEDVILDTQRALADERLEVVEWSDSTTGAIVYAVPIVVAGETTAVMWASGGDHPMTGIQRSVFERGAMVAALELLKQRHAQEVAWSMRGDLLHDLMNLTAGEESRIIERGRTYGHDLSRPHVVLVVRADHTNEMASAETKSPKVALQHIISCTRSIAMSQPGRSLVAARDGTVVMLLPYDATSDKVPTRVAEAIVSLVRRGSSSMTASVAIGDVCLRPVDYRAATDAATMAVRLTQASGVASRVIDVADLGVDRLLLSVKDPNLLRAFSERVLGPLRQNSDARSADLILTLQAYVENNLQAGTTAAVLHVHPNTLAYRLRRIEMLSGVELKTSQGILEFTLALAVERLFLPR